MKPPRLKSLKPCETLWGSAEIYNAPPMIRVLHDAVYVPWTGTDAWGVFDCEGRVVSEAVDYRGREREVSGPSPLFPEDLHGELDYCADPVMYLGFLNPHFGHFLINSLSRFWPLVYGKARLPKLVCQIFGDKSDFMATPFVRTLMTQIGLVGEDLMDLERPTRIKTLLVPETSLHEQFGVHRVYGELCEIIRAGIVPAGGIDTRSEPLYLAKTQLRAGVSRLAGEEKIVERLAKAGVRIVFPEELSFEAQLRLLASHSQIVGTTGSAFHAAAVAAPNRRILGINPTESINSNFRMLDVINKNAGRYFYPEGITYSHGGDFITTVHAPDIGAVAEDLLALLD